MQAHPPRSGSPRAGCIRGLVGRRFVLRADREAHCAYHAHEPDLGRAASKKQPAESSAIRNCDQPQRQKQTNAVLASPAVDVERMHPCFSIGCSSRPMRSSIMCSTSWASMRPVSLERSFVAPVSHLKALRASKSFGKLATLSGRHGDPGETFSECVRACTNFCKLLASCSQNLSELRGVEVYRV